MEEYKKSFVRFNLLLIGLVLLIINAVILIYSYHTGIVGLKTVMQQKIEPYNTIRNMLEPPPSSEDEKTPPVNGSAGESENEKPPMPTDGAQEKPPVPHEEAGKGGNGNGNADESGDLYAKSVYVFFYDLADESVSVVSRDEVREENELSETAKKIAERSADFGVLHAEDLYYYKQTTPNELKIAIISRAFIRFSMLKLFAVLTGLFVLAMALFYLLSRKLADRAAKPLEEAVAREKQFITDASHDLKTPLTVILTNVDILEKGKTAFGSEAAKWLDGTKQAALNMKRLIEQMLVLSESETKCEEKWETVNFSDIAEQNALVMESVAYEKNIGYTADICPEVFVCGSADSVRRIVASLIDNAIKYEKKGGNVAVELKKEKKKAVFSVRNKTSVIAEEDLPHIFERFYRADKARSTESSHGLGLAIVKNLTEQMNGKIEATADEREGTKFTVSFPLK